MPAFERAGEGHVVGIFKLAAEGKPSGDPGDCNAERRNDPVQVHGGLFALQVSVGGEDHFDYLAALEPLKEFPEMDIVRADALGRGDGAVKDVIDALIGVGVLKGEDVLGLLDNADARVVALGVGTDRAWVGVGDIAADRTERDLLLESQYGVGKKPGLFGRRSQKVVSQTLGALGPHAGEFAEFLN